MDRMSLYQSVDEGADPVAALDQLYEIELSEAIDNPVEPASDGEPERKYRWRGDVLQRIGSRINNIEGITKVVQRAAARGNRVTIVYRKLNGDRIIREVEPYSYRAQSPRRTQRNQRIYFYAYDVTGTNSIKSFLVRRLVSARQTRNKYDPRWDVEIGD